MRDPAGPHVSALHDPARCRGAPDSERIRDAPSIHGPEIHVEKVMVKFELCPIVLHNAFLRASRAAFPSEAVLFLPTCSALLGIAGSCLHSVFHADEICSLQKISWVIAKFDVQTTNEGNKSHNVGMDFLYFCMMRACRQQENAVQRTRWSAKKIFF